MPMTIEQRIARMERLECLLIAYDMEKARYSYDYEKRKTEDQSNFDVFSVPTPWQRVKTLDSENPSLEGLRIAVMRVAQEVRTLRKEKAVPDQNLIDATIKQYREEATLLCSEAARIIAAELIVDIDEAAVLVDPGYLRKQGLRFVPR